MTNTQRPTAHAAYVTAVLTEDAPRLDLDGDPIEVAETEMVETDEFAAYSIRERHEILDEWDREAGWYAHPDFHVWN